MSRFSAVLLVSVLSLATLPARPQKPKRDFQLQADREDFWTLFDRDAKLSAVASVFGFMEGPVWAPADFLIVSDEVANKIFRVYMDGRKRSWSLLAIRTATPIESVGLVLQTVTIDNGDRFFNFCVRVLEL